MNNSKRHGELINVLLCFDAESSHSISRVVLKIISQINLCFWQKFYLKIANNLLTDIVEKQETGKLSHKNPASSIIKSQTEKLKIRAEPSYF